MFDLDDDGYPTEATLEAIEKWPFEDGLVTLLHNVREIWTYGDWGWRESGRRPAEVAKWKHKKGTRYFDISTGGWSGNESIISALENNYMFMALCFERHRVGGHYLFSVPPFVATKAVVK